MATRRQLAEGFDFCDWQGASVSASPGAFFHSLFEGFVETHRPQALGTSSSARTRSICAQDRSVLRAARQT